MKVHVWVPDYASAIGGIQAFSRSLVRALRDNYPEADISVFAKNDTSYPDPEQDWTSTFVPLGWWPSKLRTAAFSAELFGRAARARPDLILATHVNFSPVAESLHKVFGTPYIAVGHGVDVWTIRDRRVVRALRRSTQLLAVSEFTRKRMAAALAIAEEQIAILPNTFEPDKFTRGPKPRFLLQRYGLRADQPVILTVARLASAERYKGYDQVLRALPSVCREIPDVRYVLGGRGPDRPRVERLIAELGLERNVILAGYVPEHELREHYNLCDVFAMPSKGEGFGIVFLEALGCGKPVLAGNKDGSVDPLLGGTIGALIDPDDASEIAATLIQVLRGTYPNRTIFDGQELRRKVIEAFGYDVFRNQLRTVLQPVLERNSAK